MSSSNDEAPLTSRQGAAEGAGFRPPPVATAAAQPDQSEALPEGLTERQEIGLLAKGIFKLPAGKSRLVRKVKKGHSHAATAPQPTALEAGSCSPGVL